MTKDPNTIKSLARTAAISVVTAGLIAAPAVALAEEAAPADTGEPTSEAAEVEAQTTPEATDPEDSVPEGSAPEADAPETEAPDAGDAEQAPEAETSVSEVTKADVDAAKDAADKADDAVKDASADLIDANKKADEAAGAADDAAKDAVDADAAAREDFADAKADADKKAEDGAAEVEKAESSVESAKDDVAAKQDAVSDAQTKKDEADKKAEAAAKDAEDAQSKVDQTQQKVDETKSDLNAATDAAAKADAEATSKKNEAGTAKDAYDAAVADQTSAAKAYDTAVADAAAAADELSRAEAALAEAKANAQGTYDKKVEAAEAAVAAAKSAKKDADDALASASSAKKTADAKVTSAKDAYDAEKAATEAAKKAAEEAARQEAAKKAALEAAKDQSSASTTVDAGRGTDTKYFVEDQAYTDSKQALYEAKLRLEAATTDREDNGIAAIFKQMALDESLTDTQRLYAYYAWASLMQNVYRGNYWDSSLIELPDSENFTYMNPSSDLLAYRIYWNIFQDGQRGMGTLNAGGVLSYGGFSHNTEDKYSDYAELMGQNYAIQNKLEKTDVNDNVIYDASHQVLYNASLKNNPINIEMLERILSYMQQVNDIRRANGLSELNVDPRLMAEAAIRCLYSSLNDMEHHSLISSGIGAQSENLAGMNKFSEYANDGIAWPFSSWYTQEKEAFDAKAAKKGTAWIEAFKNKYFNGGDMDAEESAFADEVGHYLNLINPNTTSFGMSMGQASTRNGETVTDSLGIINFVGSNNQSPFTVSEFVNLVKKYLSADYVNQVKTEAATAQQAYNTELARLVSTSTTTVGDAYDAKFKEYKDYVKKTYGLNYGTDYWFQQARFTMHGSDAIIYIVSYTPDENGDYPAKLQAAENAGWMTTDETEQTLYNEYKTLANALYNANRINSYYNATGDTSLVFTTQGAGHLDAKTVEEKVLVGEGANAYYVTKTHYYQMLTFEVDNASGDNTAVQQAAQKAYDEAKSANTAASEAYKDQSAKEAAAKEAYDAAVSAAADAQTAYDSATTAAEAAAAKLTAAETTLSTIKSAGVAGATAEAEAAVESARADKEAADAAQVTYSQAKAAADADVVSAKAAYDEADLAAKAAEAKAKTAAEAKDKAETAYKAAKATYDEAYAPYQELLDAYDDALTDAAQADSDLTRANIELQSAKDKLADAEDTLDAAQKAKAAADHMVELISSIDVDEAIKAGTTGYDELGALNAAFANAKDKAEAADALARAAAAAKAEAEKANAAYRDAADAYTKAYVNYLELKLAYEQAHTGAATDTKTDGAGAGWAGSWAAGEMTGKFVPRTSSETQGTSSETQAASLTTSTAVDTVAATDDTLPTTGDPSLLGETFVIGGITFVAAGVFLSEKKRRTVA